MKLYQGDKSAAGYLEKFMENPGGDNYRHTALFMTGWYDLLHGQPDKAKASFLRMKNIPAPFTVYNKEAFQGASAWKMPVPVLLESMSGTEQIRL